MTSSDRDDVDSSVLTYHRIIESFKFSYAWRSRLGDPKFDSSIDKVSGRKMADLNANFLSSWPKCFQFQSNFLLLEYRPYE